MLVKRLLVIAVLLPVGVALIALGGIFFALTLSVVMGLAAWEYNRLFRQADIQPADWLVILGSAALPLSRHLFGFQYSDLWIAGLTLAAMTYHLVQYERGRTRAATDFGVSLGGLLYLGWLGSYLVSLRDLPEGKWWILVALPAVWAADTGAMFIGQRFGRRKLSPRTSPNKTWEGYLGGIAAGTLAGALFCLIWGLVSPAMDPLAGALLGFVLAALTTLGDLGESMIKRQVGAKDSSSLLPGHGGVMDRIDSWLWAGVLAFYLVSWLWV